MHLFRNESSAVRKYLLVQAALAGALFGFVFGLVGKASNFAVTEPVFSFLSLLIYGGYIAYLVFPLVSSAYFIKNFREKWISLSIFGIIGLTVSIKSAYFLYANQTSINFSYAPPIHLSIVIAAAIPATVIVIASPLLYFLGHFENFMNVNFHLFLVLAMLLTALPSGFAAASVGDALVDNENHRGIGFQPANDQCKRILETMCSAKESGTLPMPNSCQNASPDVKTELKVEGYTITENGSEVMIGCPKN